MLRRIVLPLLFLSVVVSCIVAVPALSQVNAHHPSKHSGLPVVGEFQAKESESPDERQHREMREERYGDRLPKPLEDPGKLVNGQQETSRLSFIDYVKPGVSEAEIGIPVSDSTAIVVGTVMGGKCFINRAHTFVYIDYQVKLDQILKPDAGRNLQIGDTVTASRPGGAIHFPSGHVTNVLNVGHGLPGIGAQYILFLWRAIPEFDEYEIVIDSGYQLKDGRVYALDDANARFDGLDAGKFVDRIKGMVSGGGSND